ITYGNSGTQDATGVVITETVPPNSTFVAASSTGTWSCADGSAAGTTCKTTIVSLAVGPTRTVTFAVRLAAAVPAGVESLKNTASIADDAANGADLNIATNSADDTDTVNAAPDLRVTKSDQGATGVPGGLVTYTLSYNNHGTQGAIGVVLHETVPV